MAIDDAVASGVEDGAGPSIEHTESSMVPVAETSTGPPETSIGPVVSRSEQPGHETIEVPLVFDNQFFEMLQSDVNNIEALQAKEEASMTDEIVSIRDEVSIVSKPRKFSKTDLARWRNIFELYLDAEVFFSTHERNHGVRTSSAALEKLKWFQKEVTSRNLAQSFKLPQSHAAFERFLKLNLSLLKNLQFQELNQMAVSKILKSMYNQKQIDLRAQPVS